MHICYVSNINAVFQAFRCPNCGYPRNVSQIRETLFDKLDSFGIKYTSEQKLFENLAIFDFESICVQEEAFRDTNTTTWIGKHVPIFVSIFSNLVKEPIFCCNSNLHHLGASFTGALEKLAAQSKTKMKKLFLDIETTLKLKLGSILEKLTQRHNRRKQANMDDCVTKFVPQLNSCRYKKVN